MPDAPTAYHGWPAGIEIADARIAAGEPLTEDLEHDFRDRDTEVVEICDRYLTISGLAALATNGTVVLDDVIDWRDRFIHILGSMFMCADAATAALYVPGGANDDDICSYTEVAGAAGVNGIASFNFNNVGPPFVRFLYSGAGSASKAFNPRIRSVAYDVGEFAWIWVDSTTGELKLSVDVIAADVDNQAFNLMIVYSESLGIY